MSRSLDYPYNKIALNINMDCYQHKSQNEIQPLGETKKEGCLSMDQNNTSEEDKTASSYIVPPVIESSVSPLGSAGLQSVERRYYKRYYNLQENQEDQVVLLHSNRICLVSLAPRHPIIRNNLQIAHLEFEVGNKRKPTDRLSNKVTGKGKKGGQSVDEKAILTSIECTNGEKYLIRSCLRGTLIEINPLVVENPSLLSEKPFAEGHLAVILPKLPEGIDRLKSDLLTEEQYVKQIHP